MRFLRSLLFLFGQVVSAVLYTPVAILAYPLPAVPRARLIAGWAHFVLWWLRLTCGVTHRVQGLQHLPRDPCVILSKHQSAWETIAFQVIFPPQAWVLKRELLRIPVFGWALAATRPVSIDRRGGVRALGKLVTQGTSRLREGRCVVVFPEGTRVLPGESGRYNPGGALLAVKAGVPVVPVAHNAGRYWPRRGFIKRPGEIQVVVGPPIAVAGVRVRHVMAKAEAWIEAAMADIESTAAAERGAGTKCV